MIGVSCRVCEWISVTGLTFSVLSDSCLAPSLLSHHTTRLDSELVCFLGLEPLGTIAKWGMKKDSP